MIPSFKNFVPGFLFDSCSFLFNGRAYLSKKFRKWKWKLWKHFPRICHTGKLDCDCPFNLAVRIKTSSVICLQFIVEHLGYNSSFSQEDREVVAVMTVKGKDLCRDDTCQMSMVLDTGKLLWLSEVRGKRRSQLLRISWWNIWRYQLVQRHWGNCHASRSYVKAFSFVHRLRQSKV